MWLHRVVPSEGRDRRFVWQTWQEGTMWRATLLVHPRLWFADWEREARFFCGPFQTKRDAKEDACRLLLQEQCRFGRLPDLTAPTPLLEQVAGAPGQGVADRPTAGGVAGQAASVMPRLRLVVPVAKTPPTTPRAQQRDTPARSRRQTRALGLAVCCRGKTRAAWASTCGAPRRQGRGPPVAAPTQTCPVLSLVTSCSPEHPGGPRWPRRRPSRRGSAVPVGGAGPSLLPPLPRARLRRRALPPCDGRRG